MARQWNESEGVLTVGDGHTYFVEDGQGAVTPIWVHNADVCDPDAMYRGGASTKPRLGVDVKEGADGLIHPLGPNGKPQGISLNVNNLDRNVQKWGGAFRVESIPDELQILQSGSVGHSVVAPKVPMTFAEYEALCNEITLLLYNAT